MISVPSRTKKRSFFRGQRNLPTFQLLAAIVSSAIGGCVTSLAGSRFVGNGDGTAYITVEKLCGRYSGRGRATFRRGVRPGEEERAPGYELCVCRVATFLPLFFLSLSLSLDIEGASLSFEREVTNERRTGEKGGISWAILWALINRKVSMEMVMSTLSYGGKFRESLFSPSSSARPFLRPLRRVSAARENNRVCRRRS